MISVAMCTYNGEAYLTEQLESIAQQSLPVDELVVCDDRSTDRTIEILNAFAEKVPFPVRILVNERNLGSTKNFEKALKLCQGDLLFLSDQDDVWEVDKVRRLEEFLRTHPAYDAVFTDAFLIDGQGKRLSNNLWDRIGFEEEHRRLWCEGKANEILFKGYIVTGATMAIRKQVVEELAPFPTHIPMYIHDAWIAVALAVRDKIGFVRDPLMAYRIHDQQQVGLGKADKKVSMTDRFKRDRDSKLTPIRQRAARLGDLFAALSALKGVTPESVSELKSMQEHFDKRANLPVNRFLRVVPVLSELFRGRYKYSSDHWWLPLLGDLFE